MPNIDLPHRILLSLTSITFSLMMPIASIAPSAQPTIGPALDMNPMRFVPDRSAVQVLAQVVHTQSTTVGWNGNDYQVGTLSLHIVDLLSRTTPSPASNFELPYHYSQSAKLSKRNLDGWNELDLSANNFLLLACTSSDGGIHWQAIAGRNVASRQDAEVDAVRQSVLIESAATTPDRQTLLQKALVSSNERLLGFAVDALVHRKFLDKIETARLLATALASPELPERQISYLGYASPDWFSQDAASDASGGTILLSALAERMVGAPTSKRRAEFAGYLANCFPHLMKTPATAAERLMIRAVGTPMPTAVEAALHAVAFDTSSTLNTQAREQATVLIQYWKQAFAAR